MSAHVHSVDFELEPADNHRLANLCGQLDAHLHLLEQRLGVEINNRGNRFRILGDADAVQHARKMIDSLYAETLQARLSPERIHLHLQEGSTRAQQEDLLDDDSVTIRTPGGIISPRGRNQKHYLRSIMRHDLNFGIGPAGTGKTYLAMAMAIDALRKNEVQKLILTRPAVEAGEALGFLPGDLREKIEPYLRPLYDALDDMLDKDDGARLMEKGLIEIAPLAYMRGRTLSNAFVVLDEAQNTTPEQMMMFLTRLGDSSKMVVTGDVTQIDLPRSKSSGLLQVKRILSDIEGIRFHQFTESDVVRHPLVQRIIEAYETFHASPEGSEALR